MRTAKWVGLWIVIFCFIAAIPSVMAADEEWDKSICWKRSYGRGVGKIPICEPNHQKDAGLCYDVCKAGFRGVGPVCWKSCPADHHDDGAVCRRDAHIFKKDSYGRGVGKIGKIDGGQKQAGLWYKACRDGYKGVGPVCWKVCPSDYHDDGGTCRKDPHIFGKESYGRGVGTVPKTCPAGQQFQAGLCYDGCKAGYKGVGPVCWPECKKPLYGKGIKMPTECGAACTTNSDACAKWSMQWANATLKVLVTAVTAVATEDPSQLTGLLDAQKEFPVDIPDCQ